MKGSYFLHWVIGLVFVPFWSSLYRGTGRKTPVLLSFLGIILFSVVSASCTGLGMARLKLPSIHASMQVFICQFCFCCMVERAVFGLGTSQMDLSNIPCLMSMCHFIKICNFPLYVFHYSILFLDLFGGSRILVSSLCPHHGGCILRPWAACVAGHGVWLIGHKQQLMAKICCSQLRTLSMIRASQQQSHGHCQRDYMIIACDNLLS